MLIDRDVKGAEECVLAIVLLFDVLTLLDAATQNKRSRTYYKTKSICPSW